MSFKKKFNKQKSGAFKYNPMMAVTQGGNSLGKKRMMGDRGLNELTPTGNPTNLGSMLPF